MNGLEHLLDSLGRTCQVPFSCWAASGIMCFLWMSKASTWLQGRGAGCLGTKHNLPEWGEDTVPSFHLHLTCDSFHGRTKGSCSWRARVTARTARVQYNMLVCLGGAGFGFSEWISFLSICLKDISHKATAPIWWAHLPMPLTNT